MTIGKFIGCVLMVVGSAIGAGILAMPMVSAFAGFTTTVVVMFLLWILQTITGLLVVEVSLALPEQACSFNSMAEKTIGPLGKAITWVSYLLLLYTTLTAYVAGGPDLILGLLKSTVLTHVPRWVITLLFTGIMGAAVYWSTQATDFVNRGLITIKGFLLITTLALVVTYIDPVKLIAVPNINQISHILVASPILLCLFNYHFVIPSIRMYVGNKPKALKWIVISGTTICLVVYIFWLAPILSIVPLEGENSFSIIGGNTGELARVLTTIANNSWVTLCIHGFTNISMTTAFLGVSLGLFDFLADGFKRPNTRFGRFQTACLTFAVPVLINVLFTDPKNFLRYFSWSGIFVAILFLVLPPLMVYRMRNNKELASSYRNIFGNIIFVTVGIFGLIFTIFPILTSLNLFQITSH